MKLEMMAFTIASGYLSVVHFTARGDTGNTYGDRNPAIWVYGGSSPYFHIGSAVNGHWSNSQNFEEINGVRGIPTNTWIAITVAQKFENGSYNYTIQINGTLSYTVENKRPIDLTDVKVYASDPWHAPLNGTIRRLEMNTRGRKCSMFV